MGLPPPHHQSSHVDPVVLAWPSAMTLHLQRPCGDKPCQCMSQITWSLFPQKRNISFSPALISCSTVQRVHYLRGRVPSLSLSPSLPLSLSVMHAIAAPPHSPIWTLSHLYLDPFTCYVHNPKWASLCLVDRILSILD